MEKYSYYPFSSEYQLYSLSLRNIVSLTVHDIIFFPVALDKDMNSQCGSR
jgi:hypothetical protein